MPLTTRQKAEAAAMRREMLVYYLAAKAANLTPSCAECGAVDQLELDHTAPRDWIASGLNALQRQKHYEADAFAGNLQILCKTCNVRKGEPLPADYIDTPF
jgi:5-methylcytosine-specific restriction endonuclease McrA